jgi:hypothetical protein
MTPAALALLFSLTDVRTGRAVPIHEIRSDILVLVFTGARCPISRAYYRVLTDIESTYRDRGVRLLAINSNESESLAQIRRAAEQGGLGVTLLKDVRNALADELRAEYTPEVFVLDRERTVRYHGAIGNSTSPSADPGQVNAAHLRGALEALLAGKPVPHPIVKGFGCRIERSALLNPRGH